MALTRMVGVSYTKANSLIAACEVLGILQKIGTGKRNRKFIYNDYVGILSKGRNHALVLIRDLERLSMIPRITLGFGPSGEGFFRLSAFGHKENVIEAVERINKKRGE